MILLKDLLSMVMFDTTLIVKGFTGNHPGYSFVTEGMYRFNAFAILPESVLNSMVMTIRVESHGSKPVMVIVVDNE